MALEQPPPEEEDPFLAWYHAAAGVPQQQVQTPEGTIVGAGPSLPPLVPPPPPPPPPKKFDRGAPAPDEVPLASSSPRDVTVTGEPAPKPPELGEIDPTPGVFDALRGAAAAGPDAFHGAMAAIANPIAGHYVEPMAPPPLEAQVQPGLPGYLEQQDAKANELPLPSERDAALEQADKEQAFGLAKNPAELARQDQLAEHDRNAHMVSEALRLSAEDAARQQQLVEAHTRARMALQQDRDKLAADAQAFANNPQPPVGIAQGLANVVALALGGAMSSYTGGRDLALEQLNKQIDAYQQAQTHVFGMRQQGLASSEQAEADDYRDQQALRVGVYQRAMNDLQTKMQDFDPRGSMVRQLAHTYQSIAAAQQGAMTAADQKMFENRLKVEGAWQKQQEIDETKRQHNLEYDEKMAKLKGKGAGEGGFGNTKYNVATGIMSPYKDENGNPVPLMGTKPIDVKGHEKEFASAQTQVSNYAHVQDYWKQLSDIGAKIDYHKNILHDWDKTQATLVKEYDAATHAMVVYLTKELGDKLTQGQIDEQSKRIPALTQYLSQVDVGKMIGDAQEQADRDFERDMNTIGLDPSPVIGAAQSRRAPPIPPSATDELGSAQAAAAAAQTDPDRKAAQRALDAAKERVAHETEEHAAGQQAFANAAGYRPQKKIEASNLPAPVAVEITAHNQAAENYNLALEKAKTLPTEQEWMKQHKIDPKKQGDVDKARGDYQRARETEGRRVEIARKALVQSNEGVTDKLIESLESRGYGGLPVDKVKEAFKRFGGDPNSVNPDVDVRGTEAGAASGRQITIGLKKDPHARAVLRRIFFGKDI